MAYKVVEQLPEEEKSKLSEMMKSESTEEEVEPADNTEETVETEQPAEENTVEETTEEEVAEETTEEPVEETKESEATNEEQATETEETKEESAEETPTETTTEVPEETQAEPTEDVAPVEEKSNNDELFDAKLEAALLRANVREDRLESAKKLFKADHTIEDIGKVPNFVKEYPEWTKQKTKEQPKPFGIEVAGNETAETAEERRLKELGYM